jgi:hypothetical protein
MDGWNNIAGLVPARTEDPYGVMRALETACTHRGLNGLASTETLGRNSR